MRPQSVYAAINAAAEMWGMDPADIIGRSKTQPMSIPRIAVAWWCHERLGVSYPAIARKMSGRHHTTILSACQAAATAMTAQRPTRRQVHILRLVRELDAAWTPGGEIKAPEPVPVAPEPLVEPAPAQPEAAPQPEPVVIAFRRPATPPVRRHIRPIALATKLEPAFIEGPTLARLTGRRA